MTGFWRAVLVVGILAQGGIALAQQENEFAGKRVSEWLKILREHENPKFRRASLLAMETFGPKAPGVSAGLIEALEKEPEPEIRRELAIILGRMGPEVRGGDAALAEALRTDKADIVRQAAAKALGGKWAEKASEQVPVLAAALKDKHAGTRAAAAEALKSYGEQAGQAVPPLIELARDPSENRFARIDAIQIISRWGRDHAETGPTLVAVLTDKEAPPSVREAAAAGLSRNDADFPKGVMALSDALEDPNLELRKTAAASLAQLGPRASTAWPTIKKTLENQKSDSIVRFSLIRAAALLAKEHPEAVAVLSELALKDEAAENRLAAVQELGGLGPTAAPAVPTLTRIAEGDARATMREAAEAALAKIKGS